MRPLQTLSRFGNLNRVLPSYQSKVMHQHIARLCVLFEDLRIEIRGIGNRTITELDEAGSKLREIYFLRRSIGTLYEFAEALRLLNDWSEFGTVKNRFNPAEQRIWKRAVWFFSRHEAFLKQVRHDVGGHFGSTAAGYAIEHFQPDACGNLEIALYPSGGGGAKLSFAGEIAATALMRHVKGKDNPDKIRRLIRLCVVAYKHAVRAVDGITSEYLWDRFGR